MFERFNSRARLVLVHAQDEAKELRHGFIGTEHILLGLLREGDGTAAQALYSLNITFEVVRRKVEEAIAPSIEPNPGSPPFTPRAKKVLELSLREALQLGHSWIGTEHLLLGILREGDGVAAQILTSLGTELVAIRQRVVQIMRERGIDTDSPAPIEGLVSGPFAAYSHQDNHDLLLRLLVDAGMIREPTNDAERALWSELRRRFPS